MSRPALSNFFIFLSFLSLISCSSEELSHEPSKPLRIFAAASLTSIMPQLNQKFQMHHTEASIEFNFAASSILARQIEHGAEADIFISANSQWIEFLIKKKRLQKNTRRDFLSNQLVIILPINSQNKVTGLQDLSQSYIKRIALADWSHVPAGIYAKQALENFGIWEKVRAKCLAALDVRAALSYVERGDADCGLVYRTDAAISKKVKIACEIPADSQPRIQYSAALTTSSTHPLGQSFLTFLRSKEARDLFKKNGFGALNNE